MRPHATKARPEAWIARLGSDPWTRSSSSPTATPARPTRRRSTGALASLLDEASVEVTATSNPGELDSVLHRAGSRPIVVAGGDGSLHAVVAALHRRHDLKDAVLGLIPLGTGNDFARATDIPLDTEEAARLLVDGEVAPGRPDRRRARRDRGQPRARRRRRAGQPPRRTAGRSGSASIGDGKVNLGKLGYPIGAALAAIQPPYLRLRVEVDGR